jgi:hypothetical protein
MPTFKIKHLQVPLFGIVDSPNKSSWHSAFSAPTKTTVIQIDDSALDFIADELELDAEGLAGDASRYVNGNYREKARGMGGSRLGDFGEVLAYLVNRLSSREIVRVISWRAGAGQAIRGSRFPQPDFIVKDAIGLSALEVKTTEAFDYIDLRDTNKKWTWLQPCSSVVGCRALALPQLAFVGGILTPQQHSLLVRDGIVVPFPVNRGIAVAVVVVDGRVNNLRGKKKYKTPKTCHQAARNCWACIPVGCNVSLVTMPNMPGMLSLAGTHGDSGVNWFGAYQRWSQAIAWREIFAVREALGVLSDTVTTWLASPDIPEPNLLRAFWGSYLQDAMRSRGLNVELPGQLGNLNNLELDLDWSPSPLAKPINREGNLEEVARVIGEVQDSSSPFVISTRLQVGNKAVESISAEISEDFGVFRLASNTWWSKGLVESIENASVVATRLLAIAIEVSGFPMMVGIGGIPLREVVARIGDHSISLGWELKPAAPRSAAWRSWLRHFPFWFENKQWPAWPALLALGDPRVRLRVLRDGRAYLRVNKALLYRQKRLPTGR